MKRLLNCLVLLAVAGCASGQSRPRLPYDNWEIGLVAPGLMEIWVETVDVVDRRGLAYRHVHGGVPAYTNTPVGWNTGGGGGAYKPISGVDLPEIIFVRWQSLVEPQTYNVRIDIPQRVRDEMLKPERVYCLGSKTWEMEYRESIVIGMAPGGIAKVWLGGACLGPKEIGRFQAAVDKRGPSEGKTGGRYAWPDLEPETKAYIQQHGIPYGSW